MHIEHVIETFNTLYETGFKTLDEFLDALKGNNSRAYRREIYKVIDAATPLADYNFVQKRAELRYNIDRARVLTNVQFVTYEKKLGAAIEAAENDCRFDDILQFLHLLEIEYTPLQHLEVTTSVVEPHGVLARALFRKYLHTEPYRKPLGHFQHFYSDIVSIRKKAVPETEAVTLYWSVINRMKSIYVKKTIQEREKFAYCDLTARLWGVLFVPEFLPGEDLIERECLIREAFRDQNRNPERLKLQDDGKSFNLRAAIKAAKGGNVASVEALHAFITAHTSIETSLQTIAPRARKTQPYSLAFSPATEWEEKETAFARALEDCHF